MKVDSDAIVLDQFESFRSYARHDRLLRLSFIAEMGCSIFEATQDAWRAWLRRDATKYEPELSFDVTRERVVAVRGKEFHEPPQPVYWGEVQREPKKRTTPVTNRWENTERNTERIMGALERIGEPARLPQIVSASRLNYDVVSGRVFALHRQGRLVRTGNRFEYRYAPAPEPVASEEGRS